MPLCWPVNQARKLDLMIYLLWLFMILTVVVLIIGLVGFMRGSEFHKKHSNRLMRLRILFQAIALVFALILIATLQAR